jgi:hypothetical protein
MKKIFLSLALLVVVVSAALAPSHVFLTYSRTLGEVWRVDLANPHESIFVTNITVGASVGTKTNVWQGHTYAIDWQNDKLIKDGTNIVGPLMWNAQRLHGFCIDNVGRGFCISTDDPDANVDFLLWIDLATGSVTNSTWLNNGFVQSRVNGAVWGMGGF